MVPQEYISVNPPRINPKSKTPYCREAAFMIINCVGAGSYRSDPTNSDSPAPFDDSNQSIASYSE